MRPFGLIAVKIAPVFIGSFDFNRLEIDLRHINYGLDSETKKFRKRARSKFTVEEVIRIFQQLDGLVAGATSCSNGYTYLVFEIYILWMKAWFKIIFCVADNSPRTAGIITIYRIKKKRE